MLFFEGRRAKRAWPVVREYIRPNVKPKKSNSPSGTLQIRVFSSFTVSFSLLIILRKQCSAASALPLRHRITRSRSQDGAIADPLPNVARKRIEEGGYHSS